MLLPKKFKDMKKIKQLMLMICLLFGLQSAAQAQVTFDSQGKYAYDFQLAALPAGLASNGTLSPTKAADGVCSKGMVQINGGTSPQYLEVNLPSCSVFKVNMKSTSTSTRTVTVSYSTNGGTSFQNISTLLSVSTAAEFDLTSQTAFQALKNAGAIIVRLTATSGNTQIHDLFVEGSSASPVISSETEVSVFKLPGQVGNETISYAAGTIAVNVAAGTDISNVAPSTFTISSGATVSPLANAAQNFTNPVNYTVTAQDGTTTKSWTVTTTFVQSSEKEITAFRLSNAQIGNASINSSTGQILVTMPLGENLASLTPVTFTLSNSASVNPSTATARDFSSPVNYIVTAQDGSTKQWTITVATIDPNATYTAYQAESADFTGKIDAQHNGFTGTGFIDFLATGENQITFTTCNQSAGVQNAKFRYSFAKDENRSAALYVNDVFIQNVDFPRTATFTDWTDVTVAVNLNAGVNKIKLTWETTDGPNLDRMDLSGAQCQSYTLNVSATNSGTVSLSPSRADNSYFSGETVNLLAEEKPALKFDNWSGDLTGTTNPQNIVMNSNKTVVANFSVISTYKVNVTTAGIGTVTLSPAGGEYPSGTVVTATAATLMGSTFQGWSGDLSGTTASQQITVNGNKNITATFTDNFNIDFKKVIGFASATGDGFTGPTTGGDAVIAGRTNAVVYINGPAEFGKLCEILQQRIRYKTYSNNPLTIVLEAGTYTGAGGKESVWGNSMLTIQEQENLTIIGRKNVIFNFGINVKRSSNLIIRNITFQDYYDDGINIGETETHHIWVDHCTVGHPTTRPANTEHPDGGIDVKNGASYVTISWTVYRNSWKTGLVGHSDSNGGTDNGRLKVTYFGNHFVNTNSRNPRVRFGEVHVLNNLEERVGLYGIAASNNSSVFAEGNFFLNTRWPMYADRLSADFKAVYGNNTDDAFTSKTGNRPATGLKQINNEYDDSGLPVITSQILPAMLNPGGRSIKFDEFNPQNVFTPSSYYTYTALPASVVKVVVPMYAGADKIDWFPEALPLDLLAFDAKKSGTATNPTVAVTWKTTNEVNTEKFEVLRRTDNSDFQVVNTQLSKNTAGVHDYSFVDQSPLSGKSYYQLKQYDKDGKSTTSDVKIVTIAELASSFEAYPNPTDGLVTIKHQLLTGDAELAISDLQGKKQFAVKAKKGDSITKVNLSSLSAGMYIISLNIEGKKQVVKVIKK
jgi:pectate lyase